MPGLDHVPALAAELQVGLALGRAAQVGEQVGTLHLDLVDDRLEVGLDRGVADREHVGHGDLPLLADPGADRQAAPGEAAGPRHLPGDPVDQQLVGVAPAAVLRQRLGEHGDAGVADAQGLVAERAALAHQEARRDELDLDRVLARPAGRAVDVAQAPPMNDADRDQGHRGRKRSRRGMERGISEPRTLPRFNESGGRDVRMRATLSRQKAHAMPARLPIRLRRALALAGLALLAASGPPPAPTRRC